MENKPVKNQPNKSLQRQRNYSEINNHIQAKGLNAKLTVADAIKSDAISNIEDNGVLVMKVIAQSLDAKMQDYSANQLVALSNFIYSELGSQYTIGDLIIAIKKGLSGNYGKIYGKIGIDVIGEWMLLYSDIKQQELEKQRHNKRFEDDKLHSGKVNFLLANSDKVPAINNLLNRETSEQKLTRFKQLKKKEIQDDYKLVEKGKMTEKEFKDKWN